MIPSTHPQFINSIARSSLQSDVEDVACIHEICLSTPLLRCFLTFQTTAHQLGTCQLMSGQSQPCDASTRECRRRDVLKFSSKHHESMLWDTWELTTSAVPQMMNWITNEFFFTTDFMHRRFEDVRWDSSQHSFREASNHRPTLEVNEKSLRQVTYTLYIIYIIYTYN